MTTKIISVFYSGTDHEISNVTTLAGLLNQHVNTEVADQSKFGFDGCGVTYKFRGKIFGHGVDEQCKLVIDAVRAEIEKGNKVVLNAYGHSRGGITALMLAKELSNVAPELLEINLALLDPVAGNYLTTAMIDPLELCLTNKTMDLRGCKPLNKVLTLYPYQPLPAKIAHGPLIPLYPKHTKVEEDVIAGCHSGAQFNYVDASGEHQFNDASFISFARVYPFLKSCGSVFKPIVADENKLNEKLLKVYEKLNSGNHSEISRDCHSSEGLHIHAKKSAKYYNLQHQKLANAEEDKSEVLLAIEENKSIVSRFKRAMTHHPKATLFIKWLAIGIGLTALPIPAIIAVSGLLQPIVLAGRAASLWYLIVKPMTYLVTSRLLYPHYKLQTIQKNKEPSSTKGSSEAIIKGLGSKEKQPQSQTDAPKHTTLFNNSEALNNEPPLVLKTQPYIAS